MAGKQVQLWNFATQERLNSLTHAHDVVAATASPDGRWLATASQIFNTPQPLLIWDLSSGRLAFALTNHWMRRTLAFSPDSRLLGFGTYVDGVRVWDLPGRREVTNFWVSEQFGQSMGPAFQPDGEFMAFSDGYSGRIRLWNHRSQSEADPLAGHTDRVTAFAFSPDGHTLASASADRTIRLWDFPSRTTRLILTNYDAPVMMLKYSGDGDWLASAGLGRGIGLFDARSGAWRGELKGHENQVSSIEFTPNSKSLVSSGDTTVRVWSIPPDIDTRGIARLAPGLHNWWSYGAAYVLAPDGSHLLTVYTNDTFGLWSTHSLQESPRFNSPVTNVTAGAVGAGGDVVALANNSGWLTLWETRSRRIHHIFSAFNSDINRLAFSLDGKWVAASSGTTIKVFDAGTAAQVLEFQAVEANTIMSLKFSRDGEWLMAGHFTGGLQAWELNGERRAKKFGRHEWQVRGLAMSMDHSTLVSTAPDIRSWETFTGKETFRLKFRPGRFFDCAYSPDDRRLALADENGRVTVLDTTSQQEVLSLHGHRERIQALEFTPDGKTLISASADQLRVWDSSEFDEAPAPAEGKASP